MSIKTCTKRNIEALNNAVEIKNLGCSMLYGKKAEIKITDTDEVPVLKRCCTPDENAFLGCVGEDVTEHIDILSDTADTQIVDQCHPSDAGFLRMAEVIGAVLKSAIRKE